MLHHVAGHRLLGIGVGGFDAGFQLPVEQRLVRIEPERHAERLVAYLQSHLPDGAKLRDARVEIAWRRSTAVEIDCDASELPEDYCRIRCEADKAAIKAALAAGEEIKGARLVSRTNLVIR